jgi:predicted phage-related endonuclease
VGRRLEAAIIEEAKERYGYVDREQVERLTNGNGLGGHPDRRVICPERGPGILEVKTADWLVRKAWGDEPPSHYLIQSQAYQGLDKVAWGDVLVLVGGNKLERFCYDFRPKIYGEIERRVADFWQSVEANDPPPADYTRDLDTIADLYRDGTDETVDLTATTWRTKPRRRSSSRKRLGWKPRSGRTPPRPNCSTSSGRLNRDAQRLLVRATTVASIPDRTATPGEIIKGRRAYRRITVKEQA